MAVGSSGDSYLLGYCCSIIVKRGDSSFLLHLYDITFQVYKAPIASYETMFSSYPVSPNSNVGTVVTLILS